MSVALFTPTPDINKWKMSLCNNSSDNKSYWIHRVDVKISAQVTTATYMHQSQPSSQSLRINLTVHLQLWPGNHLIWCNATCKWSLPDMRRGWSEPTQFDVFWNRTKENNATILVQTCKTKSESMSALFLYSIRMHTSFYIRSRPVDERKRLK